jgi:hypothetical protein
MMKAPPLLPEEVFQRVLRIARFDGWSVVMVASVGAVLAASMGDRVGAGVGVLVAGAGAIELHGVTLLRHSDARGMSWLINSQCLIMISILGYCAIRLGHPELEALRAAITEEMKQQLEVVGSSVEEFLALFYRVTYLVVSLVTVLYQGGMAIYYFRRRAAVTAALETEK